MAWGAGFRACTCAPSSPVLRVRRMESMMGAVVVGLPTAAACCSSASGDGSALAELLAGMSTGCGRRSSAIDKPPPCCGACQK